MSQAGSTVEISNNDSGKELAATSSANMETCNSSDGDEALPPPMSRDRKASTEQAEDEPVISKRRQLKLHQLEEELILRQEFLRQKYEILLAPQSEDDGLGIAATISQAREKQLDNSRGVNARRFDQPPARAHCQTSTSQTAAANCEQTEILHAPRFTVRNNHSTPLCAHPQTSSTHVSDLTTSQLAARQSVPKDLPAFNGDPTEWPMFFSAFEHSTRVAGYTDEENMIRLQKCLHGKAREAVRNCLLLPCMVPDVIRTLKMYFGRPEHILNTLIESARNFSVPKNKLEVLIEYAFLIRNMCATIRACNLANYMNSPTLMMELLDKLSPDTKLSWALHARGIENPNLQDFSDWLYDIAEAACQVTSPVLATKQDKTPARKEARLNAHSQAPDNFSTAGFECPACNGAHKLSNCVKFAALATGAKWDMVKNKKLCRQCLGNHQRRCWFNKPCGLNGCVIKHHRLLHNSNESEPNVPRSIVASSLNNYRRSSTISKLFFRILPVLLHGKNKTILTYAFMDDGSSLTLIDEKLANDLGENGIQKSLCIRWTGDVTRYDENSRMLNLKISSTEPKNKRYPLRDVHTVKDLNLAAETMLADEVKSVYSYLRDIPLHSFAGVIPKLIIGANNPNLSISLTVREGAWHEPIAIKTRLGWTLFGGSSSTQIGSLNLHKCDCNNDSEIHTLIKNYLSEEIMGVDSQKTVVFSKEEQRAIDMLEGTCEFRKDHFVAGLLWKNEDQHLPESLPTAVSRMKCLTRKMLKDPELTIILKQQIDNIIDKGYATRLPREVIEQKAGKVWYLPIFIVRNPHKPNKVRLVWDAAAKTRGHALNDFLLKGPDLLVPLLRVLFNFRMKSIAICGDISEMFHRIRVREEDTEAQRFVWWNEQENDISVFKLNVLPFGASCSPCIAHFVRDRNAAMHANDNSRAAEAITQHHYVDDFIDSTNTIDEAIALAKDVRDIHARGGFHMRKWLSNSPEVLDALTENNSIENKIFLRNDSATQYEKVLGMYWDPKADVFRYILKFVHLKRDILTQEIIPTKREVLRVLMSVFDPIGFLSCVMTYLKIILQDIWRCAMEWDEEIKADLYSKWRDWVSYLPLITSVTIPRCYSRKMELKGCAVQLHTFVDASENACAAVSYFRIDYNCEVEVRIVAAKTKVSPLRPLSIPRLELQAAVIGARLAQTIQNEHKIEFKKKILWTDSKTVLNWIRNDSRQFQQYVMFRVAEIHTLTDVSEWKWIPTKLNVADIATKNTPSVTINEQWINGPRFLHQTESEWPHLSKAKIFLYKAAQMECFTDEWTAIKSGRQLPKESVLYKLNIYLDEDDVIYLKNRAEYLPLADK